MMDVLKPSPLQIGRANDMLGVRQQQIISLLTARGGLCVEIVLQELGGNRRCGQLTLEKLVQAGLVQITGRHGRKGLPSAVVELCGPRAQRPDL